MHHSRYLAVATLDEETGDLFVEIHGRTFLPFSAGEQGPSARSRPDGLLLSVTGHQTLTVDAESGLSTAYSLDGRVRNLCADLEG